MPITEVPLGTLVLDYTIYPRHAVDQTNVRSIVDALEKGVKLPPIIADKVTRRVADGFHRTLGYKRFGMSMDDMVSVDLRDYADDAELFAESIRLNAGHGQRLTKYDIAVLTTKAGELGITRDVVADMLSITTIRLDEITIGRIADKISTPGLQPVPVHLKRSVRHMAGATLTDEQAKVNDQLSGWSPQYHVRQINMVIENNMFEMRPEWLEDFVKLRRLLDQVLV